MKHAAGILVAGLMAVSGCAPAVPQVTVFYAPAFSPVMTEIKTTLESELQVRLAGEVSGSQVACRKVVDLGRECDVLMLADAGLFRSLAGSHVDWRLEFAHDEIVLGVGIRARRVDDAEADWTKVVLDPEISIGRVNENLGPMGYRTLLVWTLREDQGHPHFKTRMLGKTAKVLDHVDHLAAFLKNGDLDYGFLYRTTCRQFDIRYILLSPSLNLGAEGQAYHKVSVTFQKHQIPVTVPGGLITYGVSIPRTAARPDLGRVFISHVFRDQAAVFSDKGYQVYLPRFFGTPEQHEAIAPWAEYGGAF